MSIKNIGPDDLRQWISEDKAVLVDVREAHEVAAERIEGAHHLPLSGFHPSLLPDHDDKIVVYHCASGTRTNTFGHHLAIAADKARDVYHLAGGILAWKQSGFAVS